MTGQASQTFLRASATEPPVPLLLDVVTAFERKQVRYCYWRSGRRVGEAMSGRTDLDLLIAREDQHRARIVLLDCGLKEFPAVANRSHPAIASFLGYDVASEQIIHVHAHFRLVVGRKLLSDYRLPWEQMLLCRAQSHPSLPVRVLDPYSEALLLVIRACLELERTDSVARRNWSATVQKFGRDRTDLMARVNPGTMRERAAEALGEALADQVTAALFCDAPLERQWQLRRRIRKLLAERRAYTAPEALLRDVWRGIAWAAGAVNARTLHLPRPWSRRAAGGGCVVAVLGVDGSGKSTVVRSLKSWLGAEVDVLPVYFGTGDGRPTLLMLPFKLLVPLARRIFPIKPKGSSHGRVSDRAPGPFYSAMMSTWAALVAVEKRTKLRTAHRAAARGLVVVTDRYPQGQDPNYNDGPLLHRARWAPDWLRRYEAQTYAMAERMRPDLVIKLDVKPETAARRETDMDAAVIAERIAALRRLTFPGARVVTVDGEQSLADVLRLVRSEVWRML